MFQRYQYVMWAFPLGEGFGVFPPISWGVWGNQHLRCPYAHSCTFFVVHYVSHFNYGSEYYSSSYSGIFWPVISDSGSFSDKVSSKLGSAWCGSTTTLMPRGSGGVLGSVSVPQQQTPSAMPPLAYATYAMGSPQVGFFFRVEPPTICILYMFGSILVSAFYF